MRWSAPAGGTLHGPGARAAAGPDGRGRPGGAAGFAASDGTPRAVALAMNATSAARAIDPRARVAELRALLSGEHRVLADFLVALAAFDRQRGWRELGYAGLFPFLHRELGLSKAAAYYRKTAVELVERFPEVIDPIRDGRLCLTSVVELARVHTATNRDAVLPRFFHCSKQQAKAVSAELAPDPRPVRRTVVTAFPVPPRVEPASESADAPGRRSAATTTAGKQDGAPGPATPSQPVRPGEPQHAATLSQGGCPGEPQHAATPSRTVRPGEPQEAQAHQTRPAGPPPRDTAEPLTADLHRLHITVSKRFLEKLEAARAALSHSVLGATTEVILETALDLVLERDARRKGLVARPRPAGSTPPSGSRYVPAAVRREVWKRDGGRCQWPLASGGICGSTLRVELDHTRARGQGGRPTVENMRLLCRFHNDLAARMAYGNAVMDRYTRGDAGQVAGSEPRRNPGDDCDPVVAPVPGPAAARPPGSR